MITRGLERRHHGTARVGAYGDVWMFVALDADTKLVPSFIVGRATSHVESQNATLCINCRRLTRLTNALSKKIEKFEAAVALNFAYYNVCKTHTALRMTPAQAARIEASAWTVAELIERYGE